MQTFQHFQTPDSLNRNHPWSLISWYSWLFFSRKEKEILSSIKIQNTLFDYFDFNTTGLARSSYSGQRRLELHVHGTSGLVSFKFFLKQKQKQIQSIFHFHSCRYHFFSVFCFHRVSFIRNSPQFFLCFAVKWKFIFLPKRFSYTN